MSKPLRIAVVQLRSTPNIQDNLEAMALYSRQAADMQCDLICFPECAPQMLRDKERISVAESLKGEQIQFCRTICQEHGMGMLLGSFAQRLPDDGEHFANTSVVFDRKGEILGTYQKAHLFEAYIDGKRAFHEAALVHAGDAKPVVIDFEGWKLGLSICYDVRFPEFYRLMVDEHADVLCVPSAFTYETGAAHWEVLLRARAIENTCYVVSPAQCGHNYGNRRTWGHSMVVSPWGDIVAQIGDAPGIVITTLSKDLLKDARERNPSVANRRI